MRKLVRHRTAVAVAVIVLVGAVGAVAIGRAGTASSHRQPLATTHPSFSSQMDLPRSNGAIPAIVATTAEQSRVTNLVRLVGTADTLGVYTGTMPGGTVVVSFGGPHMATPFVALARFQGAEQLTVVSTGAGSPSSVDKVELAGLIAPNVVRVDVVTAGGTTSVPLIRNAFNYVGTSPGTFPSRVLAYDATGSIVGSEEILPATVPGSG
jgi:hypothetical protein